MLRGRAAAGYGSLRDASEDTPRDGDTSTEQTCRGISDRISNQIFTIGANVNSMDQVFRQLGTPKDSADLRNRLHSIEQTTNSCIKETVNLLRELSVLSARLASSGRTYKLQCQRLMGEFEEVVQRYHSMQQKVTEKVRSTSLPKASSTQSSHVATADLIGWEDAGAGRSQQQQQQQLDLVEEENDVDLQLLREREQQIRQLEGDILDINQIFKDLGMLVHEQGEVIDTIEANVTAAHDSVEQGREQLQKAATYQIRSRKMKCCLIALLLTVIAIIVIVIVITVKVH